MRNKKNLAPFHTFASTDCPFSIRAFLAPLLLLCIDLSPAQAQNALPPRAALLTPGIHCGFLADCTRFDQIGLHISTSAAVQTGTPSSRWDLSSAVRLALTALDLAEVGVALAGRIGHAEEDDFSARLLPVSLYARVRLLPLPLPRLALAPWRLGLTYQHELVSDNFGGADPARASQGTLRLLAGQSFSRLGCGRWAGRLFYARGGSATSRRKPGAQRHGEPVAMAWDRRCAQR